MFKKYINSLFLILFINVCYSQESNCEKYNEFISNFNKTLSNLHTYISLDKFYTEGCGNHSTFATSINVIKSFIHDFGKIRDISNSRVKGKVLPFTDDNGNLSLRAVCDSISTHSFIISISSNKRLYMEILVKKVRDEWKICEVTKLFEINPNYQNMRNPSESLFKNTMILNDYLLLEMSAEYLDPIIIKYEDLENVMIVNLPGQESRVEVMLKNGNLYYSDLKYLNDIDKLNLIVKDINHKKTK